jgi:hypothetical protein
MKRRPWRTAGLLGAGLVLLVLSTWTWQRAGLSWQNPLRRAPRQTAHHPARHISLPDHRGPTPHGRRQLDAVPHGHAAEVLA